MKITIDINERQEMFLRQFAERQFDGAPDNLSTRTPIFVVEREHELIAPEGYGDGKTFFSYWHDGEHLLAETADELIEKVTGAKPIPLSEAIEAMNIIVGGNEVFVVDEKDYLEAYGIEGFEKLETHTTYKPVAFFLTLAEAKRYKNDYQSHNCGNCRIYGYGLGYSNKGDLPEFRNMLMKIGTALLNYERDGVNID